MSRYETVLRFTAAIAANSSLNFENNETAKNIVDQAEELYDELDKRYTKPEVIPGNFAITERKKIDK